MQQRVACFAMSDRSHFNRLLRVVVELVRAGAAVRVWTDRAFQPDLVAAGAEFADLFDPVPLAAVDDASRPASSRFVTFAAARGVEISTAVGGWRPDLIVHDSFALIGRVVAERLHLPLVTLLSGHAVDGPTFRTGLLTDPRVHTDPRCLAAVERLRSEFGLADASPFSYVADPSPWLNVYSEPAEWLDERERGQLGRIVYFGSLASNAFDRLPPPRPDRGGLAIYAAFGTIIWRYWMAEAVAALQAIAEAAAALPGARLTIGLGGARLPDSAVATLERAGATLCAFADQWTELSAADVFVTHHGLASTHEAVALAVPMLSLPFFWDQPALARRSAELGLALPLIEGVLPGQQLQPATVAAALQTLAGRRSVMHERLLEARQWERRTIAARPRLARQILVVAGG